MKPTTITIILCVFVITTVFPQSKSFYTLRNKFAGSSNVFCFSTSGFLARGILSMAGEHEFTDAIKEVKNIRLIVIPKEAFKKQRVTLAGFRKFAKKESFEELVHVKDHGDDVTLLMQTDQENKNNCYLILVDSGDEVVVIEVKGYIDPDIMRNKENKIAYDHN